MIDLPDRTVIALTPDTIRERHVARSRAFCAQHGAVDLLDRKLLASPSLREARRMIGEEMRLDYVAMARFGQRDHDDRGRRDKTPRMLAFLKASIGNEVTAADFAAAAECSTSAAHAFMADHRGWLTKIGHGTYLVVDADQERAAAKAGTPPTLPAAVVQQDAAAVEAAAIADAALAALTGQQAPARDMRRPLP